MTTLALLPIPTRRWVAFAVIMVGLLGSGSTGWASCGDYLVHGSAGGESGYDLGVSVSFFPARSEGPDQPSSPCIGGRCQSLPWGPLAPSTYRVTVSELTASMHAASTAGAHPMLLQWLIPTDGQFPPQPWLAIDLPPPQDLA